MPNDYNAFCAEREAKRVEEKRRRDLERQVEEVERERDQRKADRMRGVGSGSDAKVGVGRGRGRGLTMPAWMKQKKEEQIGKIPNPGTPGSTVKPPTMKNISKVILLLNMVARGDVDDSLESEIKTECSKYGPVFGCTIFEVPRSETSVPAHDAVRVFVKFERQASAIKALIAMNKRFFAGREIRAQFFDEERYTLGDLTVRPSDATS